MRSSAYQLVRPARPAIEPPRLDADQQAVVDHPGGPLLVLAGPGTGKTTTLVEAVVARIAAGADPEQVLVLTFGRRAAAELRGRITARLGRATKEPLARTFHSYAFGLLRREAAVRGEPPPRLLSGPEQDLVVRDLLAGDIDTGGTGWPARLRPALATRGFAQELRDLLMRAYERGVDAPELAALGRRHGRDDWVAAARFMRQYAGVTALRETASYDPAELIRAVVGLWLREPGLLAAERAARRHVYVDEMQDTDPAQIELLRLLAGDGRDLVAVGDADQSIYGFRGAEVGGIRDFPDTFPTSTGASAPVRTLATCRRSGPVLLAASRRVAEALPGPRRHRVLRADPEQSDGEVSVAVLRSATQEAAHVAARLRQAHLIDGVPWARMAVLVRSTVHAMPVLRRALGSAGVPVAVSGDEVPLVQEPAVRPLMLLLRVATRPDSLDEDTAVELLTSPVGGADVIAMRRLRQALRRTELAGGGRRTSGALLVEALDDPAALEVDGPAVRPAETVRRLLATARAAAARPGVTAEEVLWDIWTGTGLAARWERASRDGGPAGDAADRGLDAVVALFDAAARFCDRLPGAGPEVFVEHLAGQEIPSDEPAVRPVATDAVQVLTAHAAKGLEWDIVCVAGVQEGVWPDLRMRGSFLGSERLVELMRPGAAPMAGAVVTAATLGRLLEEERRLFYVAVTRARRAVLVTAVTSEREGLTPSRFLGEIQPLAGEEPRRVEAAIPVLSLTSLVAELRRAVADPSTPGAVAHVAARRLAKLAAAEVRGADPDSWWGLPQLSDDRPLRGAEESVAVSPSKVESFRRCQLRWFLEHVGGGDPAGAAQSVGMLVHAVAEGARTAADCTEESLLARLESLARAVDLGSGWVGRREHDKARTMVRRLAKWLAANGRELVATELEFSAEVGRARLGGRVDRLERDADGRLVVVDLKTGTSKVPADELAEHGQLATYQVAVQAGAFDDDHSDDDHSDDDPSDDDPSDDDPSDDDPSDDDPAPVPAVSGGAELVQVGAGGGKDFAVQPQAPLDAADDPDWARRMVLDVAEGMAGSAFAAVENRYCGFCPVSSSCPIQDDGRVVGQ